MFTAFDVSMTNNIEDFFREFALAYNFFCGKLRNIYLHIEVVLNRTLSTKRGDLLSVQLYLYVNVFLILLYSARLHLVIFGTSSAQAFQHASSDSLHSRDE